MDQPLKQEWTLHTLLKIFNRTRAKDQPSRDQAICDAHNAALAAAVESSVIHPAELITKMAKLEQQLTAKRRLLDDVIKGQLQAVSELELQLAAERRRREQAENDYRQADIRHHVAWRKLEQQLLSERQCREQAEHWLEDKREDARMFAADASKYHRQLLSALAAIEKKNAKLLELIQFHISGDPCHVLETIALEPDLSALHEHDDGIREEVASKWVDWRFTDEGMKEHDAKVREPMVEALKRIENANHGHDLAKCRAIARDALAKVK